MDDDWLPYPTGRQRADADYLSVGSKWWTYLAEERLKVVGASWRSIFR